MLSGHQGVDGLATPVDYSGVFLVERDPQMPHALRSRNTPVPQIQAEQIAIRRCGECRELMEYPAD
jgi:hypothetical protein